MFNKIKINLRLMIGFGVLLLLLISLTLFGLQNLRNLSNEINQLNDVAVAKLQWINKMSDAVRFRGTSIRDVVLKQDIAFMRTEVKIMHAANDEYQQAFSILQEMTQNQAEEKALMSEIQSFEQKLAGIVDEILEHALNEDQESAVNAISDKLRPVQGELIELITVLSDIIKQQIEQTASTANDSYTQSATLSGALMFLALILGILLSYLITRSITQPLNKIREALASIETQGDYSIRVEVKGKDETAQTANSLNQFLSQLQQTFSHINTNLEAVGRGEFNRELNLKLPGDLAKLQSGVNASIHSVSTTMNALIEVMDSLHNGNFTTRMSNEVQGSFKIKVDQAVESIHDVIMSINTVMDGMAQGRFDQRLPNDARGELFELVDHINSSLDTISLAITQTVDLSQSLAAGDLTQRIEGQFNGDLASMKNALNSATAQLGQTLQAILQDSDQVTEASLNINNGNTDLNQRTQEQASSLERTAAAMAQMTQAIEGSRDLAFQAEKIAQNARNEAQSGSDIMQKAVMAMNEIRSASKKISEITTLIDSIAFQTNLLALNAAVEAARAGDHGRGFAVVAGEVRSLAGKSSDAARTIRELIDNAQNQIDQGTQMVEESDQALVQIQKLINKMGDSINDISKASEEQSLGVNAVHQDIEQIDKVTQQNALLVEQISETTQQLQQQASNLRQRVGSFILAGTKHTQRIK